MVPCSPVVIQRRYSEKPAESSQTTWKDIPLPPIFMVMATGTSYVRERNISIEKKNIRQPTAFLCNLLQGVCVFIARPCRQRLMLLFCTYFHRVPWKPKIENSPKTVSYLYIKRGEGVWLVCATYKRLTSNVFFWITGLSPLSHPRFDLGI